MRLADSNWCVAIATPVSAKRGCQHTCCTFCCNHPTSVSLISLKSHIKSAKTVKGTGRKEFLATLRKSLHSWHSNGSLAAPQSVQSPQCHFHILLTLHGRLHGLGHNVSVALTWSPFVLANLMPPGRSGESGRCLSCELLTLHQLASTDLIFDAFQANRVLPFIAIFWDKETFTRTHDFWGVVASILSRDGPWHFLGLVDIQSSWQPKHRNRNRLIDDKLKTPK